MAGSVRGGTRRVRNDAKPTAANGKRKPFKGGVKERKRASAFLRQKEKLFHAIAEHIADVIVIVDAQGKILYMNDAGSDLSGDIALGKNAFVLLHADSHNLCKQALDKSIATGKSVILEHAGPKSTWWLARFIPIGEFGGPVPAVVIICTDITQHKKMEK